MKKKRILVACHHELVPPDSIEGLSDQEISDWRTEFDVISALRDNGHEVQPVGMDDDIDLLRQAIVELKPHACFNLLVEFHGAANYDQHIVSYLELHKTPYTGCNPRGMTLARDKGLSKKVLMHHGIRVPYFGVFPKGRRVRRDPDLAFPLFVKSLNEEASLGISRASIVRTEKQLDERVRFIHERVGTDAIAEEYIEGREFYVGVMGNTRLQAFPAWELHIPDLPDGAPRIATRRVKWDIGYQRTIGIKNKRAELPDEVDREMGTIAKDVYRHLGLSGYARMDLRMRPDGRIYVLEANPNPDVTFGEDFAEGAEAAGIEYEELLDRIVKLGISYQAEWKQFEED